jgi:prolyl 4-hydroxylase
MNNPAPPPVADLDALRAASDAGDAAARRELGQRLLIGDRAPLDHAEALKLIRSAMDAGDAAATAQMATLTATGGLVAKDIEGALDLLGLAARRGSASARSQLLLLTGGEPDAGGADVDWPALRRRVDLSGWREAPSRRPLCEAPRVRVAEAFLGPTLCRWLIGLSHGRLKPALMFDGKKARFSAARNNSDFPFDIVSADVIVALVRERVAALTRLPIFAMEPPQIFHYATGQEIKPHFDHVRAADRDGYQGERIATFILYLNDDYEGGDLEFPKVGLKYRGRAGDAVYFANVDPAGRPDPLSLHGGLPVTAGEKYVLSQWIQDRPFGNAAVLDRP